MATLLNPSVAAAKLRLSLLDNFRHHWQHVPTVSTREQPTGETLQRFLDPLTAVASASPQPDNEPWAVTIERMSNTERVAEISEETWYYFLEVLPPKILEGSWFAFAEGQEPLRIFYRTQGKHYVRQLTEEQSMRVCELTGLPKEYGSY